MRETTLLAQALDGRTMALSGDPVPVAEDVWKNPSVADGLTAFAVGRTERSPTAAGVWSGASSLGSTARGSGSGRVGPPALLGAMDLSPDARRVLVDVTDPVRDTSALFVLDAATGVPARVTLGAGNQGAGLYSPDGRSIAFAWDLKGAYDLYRREVGTGGERSPLVVNSGWKFPESWSPDGRCLSYVQSDPGKPRDIWVLPMTGEARPFPFAQTPADEWGSAFSPDGPLRSGRRRTGSGFSRSSRWVRRSRPRSSSRREPRGDRPDGLVRRNRTAGRARRRTLPVIGCCHPEAISPSPRA